MAEKHSMPTNPRFQDLTGQRFTRLRVLRYTDTDHHRQSKWLCRCDCGAEKIVGHNALKSGDTRSCGCLHKEQQSKRLTIHGMTNRYEYRVWRGMRNRCNNPRDDRFIRYGGRGITVCRKWDLSFQAFYDDMGPAYSLEHSLDRIDNDGSYCPVNCRWATRSEQQRNRRDTQHITFNGETHSVPDWADKLHINKSTLLYRLRRGWSVERALTALVQHRHTS